MSIRKITEFPEKILRDKTAHVENIDDDLKKLVKNMFDTMYLNDGVGRYFLARRVGDTSVAYFGALMYVVIGATAMQNGVNQAILPRLPMRVKCWHGIT